MKLIHKKMDLFDAPKNSLIIHACNAKGVWGGGIAAEFASRYPRSYGYYNKFCRAEGRLCGRFGVAFYPDTEEHQVGFLITSEGYGKDKDSTDEILTQTSLAVKECLDYCEYISRTNSGQLVEVYSNKFNSGLFGVPWDMTEGVIKTIIKGYENITWIVCDL